MAGPGELFLTAESLFYKGGFSDGDVLFDWIWDWAEADGFDPPDAWFKNHHQALQQLVRAYLLPLMPGEFTVYDIGTIHNPIRIGTWHGSDWDDRADSAPPEVRDLFVRIPGSAVADAVKQAGSHTEQATAPL